MVRVERLPTLVRSRASRTRWTISLNWARSDSTTKCIGRLAHLAPASYNRLQAQFVKEGKSLTTLLACAHARSIEDLLKRDVDTDNVLVDPFTDVQYIKAELLAEGAGNRSISSRCRVQKQ